MLEWLEFFLDVFREPIAESLQKRIDNRTNGEACCTTTAISSPPETSSYDKRREMEQNVFRDQMYLSPEERSKYFETRELSVEDAYKLIQDRVAQKMHEQRLEREKKNMVWNQKYLTDEEYDDFCLGKTSVEKTLSLVEQRKSLGEIKLLEFSIAKKSQDKIYWDRLKREKKIYLTQEEQSLSLSRMELIYLIEKKKANNTFPSNADYALFDKICSGVLILDTCIFESASDAEVKRVLDVLLAHCKKYSFKVTLLPDVYHEIINHSNEDKENDEEARFRSRSAKKEIERFQKEDSLIFPDESQIKRNSKYVPAYADNQICEEMQKHIDAEEPCTILTDDRDLRLRVRGMIQKLPPHQQNKYFCFSIDDILNAITNINIQEEKKKWP